MAAPVAMVVHRQISGDPKQPGHAPLPQSREPGTGSPAGTPPAPDPAQFCGRRLPGGSSREGAGGERRGAFRNGSFAS